MDVISFEDLKEAVVIEVFGTTYDVLAAQVDRVSANNPHDKREHLSLFLIETESDAKYPTNVLIYYTEKKDMEFYDLVRKASVEEDTDSDEEVEPKSVMVNKRDVAWSDISLP